MNLSLRLSFIVTILATSTISHAGTIALGFELGTSTASHVKAALSKFSNLEEPLVSGLTGGAYLKTDGTGYDIDGLNNVAYIFDKNNILGAVIINMSQGRFGDIYGALSRKYKIDSVQKPFVGDQFARFNSDDAVIEIDSPHMSFEMEVRYIRNDIRVLAARQAAEEKKKKIKKDQEQF